MDWRFTPYAIPLFTGAAILLALVVVAWRRRDATGAALLAALSLASAIYVLGYAMELSSTALSGVQFWIKVEYIGIVAAPVLIFALMLVFTERDLYLTRLTALILAWIPVTTLIFAWTNEQHHLIWRDMHLVTVSGWTFLEFTPGGWYWINASYIMLLIVASTLLLVPTALHRQGLYRAQTRFLLAGLTVPMVAFAIYLSRILSLPIDLTAYSLVITSGVFAWAVLRYQFLDILPVARQVVLDSMADAVIVADANGYVRHLNPAARQLIVLSQHDLLGRKLGDLFGGQLTPVVPPDGCDPCSEIVLDGNGTPRYFDTRKSLLTRHSGVPEGTLIVLRDITERKQAEEERERLIAGLDAFAHTVAHDLKNLVTILITYGISLQEDFPTMAPADIRAYLDVIAQTGHKMNSVIDALLLLAHVEKTGYIPVQPLDMGAIVEQVLDRLAVEIAHAGARIVLPPTWPTARGYAPWVEEIWVNYITNAIKYGGEPPLVTLIAVAQPNGSIRFGVQDNGAGLTPDQQAQLFTPFRQLHQLRGDGHGLGLSIVRDITEKLGGRVGVESQLGQGSLFSFTLPSSPDPAAPAPEQAAAPAPETRARDQLPTA